MTKPYTAKFCRLYGGKRSQISITSAQKSIISAHIAGITPGFFGVSRAKRHSWKTWPFFARTERQTLKNHSLLFTHTCFRTQLCALFLLLQYRNRIEPQNHTVASASRMQQSMTRSATRGRCEQNRPSVAVNKSHMPQTAQIPARNKSCLLYTSPSPRDATLSRMPSSA